MKGVIVGLVRAAFPRILYYRPYIASVVRQQADGSLDIKAEDPKVPSMAGVLLRHGIPGLKVTVAAESSVVLWFSEGDPAKSFCALWAGSEVTVKSLTITAEQILLGGTEPGTRGQTLQDYLEKIGPHTHSGVTTGGGTSGPSPALAQVPDVRTTVVRVK